MVTRDPAVGVSLEQLVGEEVAVLTAREGEQVTITGPYMRLKPKAAEITALAVHELATNALKYGALSVPDGRIEIGWSILEKQEILRFIWTETVPRGIGPPTRDGFGTEFIKRLVAYELDADADLQFGPNGVSCRIDVPLTMAIAPEPKRVASDETA
jgi:two-component system CheB/CheR fusion protein